MSPTFLIMFSEETLLRLKQFLSRLMQTLSRQQNSVISTSLMMLKHRVLCSLNEVTSQGLREFFQAQLGSSLASWLSGDACASQGNISEFTIELPVPVFTTYWKEDKGTQTSDRNLTVRGILEDRNLKVK